MLMTCLIDAFGLMNYNFFASNAATSNKIANDCTFYAEEGAQVMIFD